MIYGQPITFGGASGEISITDNGTFDVKKYATANVNVVPVLLWTNASPTSSFAPQTVSIAGSQYEAYLVEIRSSTSNTKTGVGLIEKTGGVESNQNVAVYSASDWTGEHVLRDITATADNSIDFGSAQHGPGGNTPTVDYAYGIPTRIWGVKFTL